MFGTYAIVVGWLAVAPPPHATPARARCAAMAAAANEQYEFVTKYGVDPRGAANDVCADAAFGNAITMNGQVGELNNCNELQAAIDAAGDRLVVLKFQRAECAACASTHHLFAAAAKRRRKTAHFFTVDTMENEPFCRHEVRVKAVPAVHVYRDGTLQATLPLGRSKWPTFVNVLNELTSHPERNDDGAKGGWLLRPWRLFSPLLRPWRWLLTPV